MAGLRSGILGKDSSSTLHLAESEDDIHRRVELEVEEDDPSLSYDERFQKECVVVDTSLEASVYLAAPSGNLGYDSGHRSHLDEGVYSSSPILSPLLTAEMEGHRERLSNIARKRLKRTVTKQKKALHRMITL